MSRLVLGIDLGEASVGTALTRVQEDESLLGIEHFGSRVFSPVTDPKSKVPLNKGRQAARGARKGHQRTRRRKLKLKSALVRAGLLPGDEAALDAVLGRSGNAEDKRRYDPYHLRARALDEPLEPFELGRVFTHLAERRGFRSNKKLRLSEILDRDSKLSAEAEEPEEEPTETLSDDEAKELKATYKDIQDLEAAMRAEGARTLGELFWKWKQNGRGRIRGRRTSRDMYIAEFETICKAQARWNPILLSLDLHGAIRGTFEQRPLKPIRIKRPRLQKLASDESAQAIARITKNCRLFTNRPVARRDNFYSHRFRILQTLRNVRVDPGNGPERPLTNEEVRNIAEQLQTKDVMTWPAIRRAIGATQKSAKINYERDPKMAKGLPGNKVEARFKRILGDKWDTSLDLPEDHERWQIELMQDLETSTDAKRLFENLQRAKANGNPLYPLTRDQALEVAGMILSRKTVNYSSRAMRKLCAELLTGARSTYDAIQKMEDGAESQTLMLDLLPPPPFIPNPRVRRGLYEIRKVVNALIEKHGKPDEIRIELARDIKQTELDRKKENKRQKEQQDRNTLAKAFYKENGIDEPSGEQILRHRLWLECDKKCPYTGRTISASDLLSERIEVEHILPLPRSGDDSYANLTLTFREINLEKGNRTPREWLSDPVQWSEAHDRFKHMRNRAKLKKFETEALEDDFTQRQLSDTRYVCLAAKKYLETLGIPVWVTNGGATGILRYQWGLNGVIPARMLKDPSKVKPGEKHRYDHRHHAVDALVVALTTPKRYREALMVKRDLLKESRPPTEHFRSAVKALVDTTLTSHDLDKGIRGGLHDEFFYGRKLDDDGNPMYVRRVAIDSLAKADHEKTRKKLEKVYDADLRRRLLLHLQAFRDPKEAFPKSGVVLRDGSGEEMRVETVRVKHRLTDQSARAWKEGRYITTSNNHHGEIVQNAKGKLECRVVAMVDAAQRIRKEKRSPYGATLKPGEALVHCLSENEIVEYDGQPMRVLAVSTNDLRLRDLNDGRVANELEGTRIRSSEEFGKLGRKLKVDPLGNLIYPDGT